MRRRWFCFGMLIGISLSIGAVVASEHYRPASETAFSPSGGAQELVLKAINSCRSELRLAAYSLTSKDVADALIAAHKRRADVKVVADKRGNANDEVSVVDDLIRAGIPARYNGRYPIHHHKFIICDGWVVQTGSFNYSKSAHTRNAENVDVDWRAPGRYRAYRERWQKLWDEAEDVGNR